MNHVYRFIWNCGLACLVPAAEGTRGRHKRSNRRSKSARNISIGRTLALTGTLALLGLASKANAQEQTLLNLEDSPAQGYTLYSYSFQAQLSQTFLTFQFQQDPSYWQLDNVSVTNSTNSQLLLNGDFQGGSVANSAGQQVPDNWTFIGQVGLQAGGTLDSQCGVNPANNCYSDGAVGGVDGLFQSFSTTIGATYTLSFELQNDSDSEGGTTKAIVQVGATEDQGGTLVPVPPTPPAATNIILAGSPYLAAGLGTTLNPVFDGGTLQLDSSGPTFSQNFTVNSTNGTIDTAGLTSTLSGVLSGPGGLTFMNSGSGGSVSLTTTNTYLGGTTVNSGTVLALTGTGSIANSSGVLDNGTFDISGTTAGATIQSLSGSGAVTLGSQSLTLSNAAGTFGGVISGTGGLTVAGGVETLAGINAYTGATSISTGATLALSGTGSIANSSGVLDNGTFDISGTTAGATIQSLSGSGAVALGNQTLTLSNAAGTFAGVIGGTGGLTLLGGSETLSGTNTFVGATAIASGTTLALSGTGSIASSSGVLDSGTFDLSATVAGASIQSLSGSGAVSLGNQTLTLSNAAGTFAGDIGGTGSLIVLNGNEALSGTNGYTGATGIGLNAILALSGSGSIANSSSVLDNGTLDISGTNAGASLQALAGAGTVALGNQTLTITNAAGNFAGSIVGTGGLALTGGSQTLTGSSTYSGGTGIGTGATLALVGAGSIANSSTLADNGTFDISGTNAGASIQSLAGSGNVVLGSQNLTLRNAAGTFAGSVNGTGGVNVSGGTENLAGINGYTGATAVANGATLALSAGGTIANSSGVTDNGTFDISGTNNGASIQSLTGNGAVALGSQTLTLANAADTFAGSIGGTGGLAVTGGTETLTGTNTYAGGTAVSGGGNLIVNSDAALGAVSGSIALNDGTLQNSASFATNRNTFLAGNGTFDTNTGTVLDDSGNLAGVGMLIKSGTGTLELCGSVTNSGGTSVTAGALVICGNDTAAGNISIASGAMLAVSGAGRIANSGITDNGSLDISAATAGASLQSLAGSGTVALGNQTLTLSNAAGTFSGVIDGAGGLALSGGAETLSGANLYSGNTAIGSGATLALNGAGTIANSSGVTDDGTLDISGTTSGASVQSLSGSGTVALGTRTLTLSNAAGTFAGSIGGTGGLALALGSETLGGANSYTGPTNIGTGTTLALSGAGSITNSAVTDNGRFDISGTVGGASIQSLSGSGSVTLGNQNLALSSASGTFAGTIGGAGGVTVAAGSEMLTGANYYSGNTAVGVGATLALSGIGSIAASSGVTDNGNLDISGTSGASLQSLSGAGAVALGSKNLTLNNASGIFAGSIGGGGALAITGGSETLTGTSTYAGGTGVSGGSQLSVSSDAALGAAAGALTLNDGTLLSTTSFTTNRDTTLAGNGAFEMTAGTVLTDGGNVAGVGMLIKSGAGTLQLCGTVANSGGITVTAGVLAICGNDTTAGITSVGSGSTLALTGAGRLTNSSGVIDNGTVDISGASAGTTLQSLSGNGVVALGNQTLTLSNAAGTFAGSIGGGGGLAVTGGTETLTGTSTYTGGTVVDGSRLVVNSDAALGAVSGGLTLNNSTLENTASMTTARAINLTGNNTLLTDPGSTFTQNGQVSGDGALVKGGDGTLVLNGDNRGWGQAGNDTLGGLTIDAGLVEVSNPYGLGYGPVVVNSGVIATTVNILTGQTIEIVGDTVLNIDAGTTTTLTGTIVTGGTGSCFNKTGLGTLAISGTATLSNGTCVLQGQLNVNGVLNSTVSVDSGAVLRGVGTIVGPTQVRGTLAPGISSGTLTATASVTMESGSTYQENINGTATGTGPGSYSRLLVTGAGSQFIASGAVLDVNLNIPGTSSSVAKFAALSQPGGLSETSASTTSPPAIGDSFRIVTAAGGIVGKFAAFSQPEGLSPNTRLAIFYDPFGDNSIDLSVVPTSYASYLQGVSANENAHSAGSAIDQILAADQAGNSTKAQQQLAYMISGLSAAALPGIMTALAGEVHAEVAAVAPQAGQWLQTSVERQLEFSSADGEMGAPDPGKAFWFDATASHGGWDTDNFASGFTVNRSQFTVGFDLLAGQGNAAGIGFSHSLATVSSPVASGSIDESLGFAYGQYSLNPLIFDAMLGGGTNRWQTTRVDPLGLTAQTLDTSSSGSSELFSAGIRLPLHVGSMMLEPFARTLWQRTARAAFDEGTVQDALSGPAYSATGVRTMGGVLLGPANPSPLASLFTYQINLGVGYDSGSLMRPTVAASLSGTSTTILAPDIGRVFAQLNLNGTARLGRSTYAYFGVMDEQRSGKSEEAGINAGVRAIF